MHTKIITAKSRDIIIHDISMIKNFFFFLNQRCKPAAKSQSPYRGWPEFLSTPFSFSVKVNSQVNLFPPAYFWNLALLNFHLIFFKYTLSPPMAWSTRLCEDEVSLSKRKTAFLSKPKGKQSCILLDARWKLSAKWNALGCLCLFGSNLRRNTQAPSSAIMVSWSPLLQYRACYTVALLHAVEEN